MLENTAEFLEELRHTIEVSNAAERLGRHPDFKRVFEDYWFKEESFRLVSGLAEHSEDSKEFKEAVDNLVFISKLMKTLPTILARGELARFSLKGANELINSGDM